MASAVRTVLMTAPDAEVAEALATVLVEERLAACASVVPGVTSIYRWEGEVQRDQEVLMVLKTTAERLPRLVDRAGGLHPYEVPEILSLPVDGGLDDYLRWVAAETAPSGGATDASAGEEVSGG